VLVVPQTIVLREFPPVAYRRRDLSCRRRQVSRRSGVDGGGPAQSTCVRPV